MRGDSDMSDSQFMMFQIQKQQKLKRETDKINSDLRIKSISKKQKAKTIWQKLKGFFNV
jgi:hypothetical protein